MNPSASPGRPALEAHRETPQPSPKTSAHNSPWRRPLTERITMHVLVVEDDARLAEALARILEDNGYTTDVVHDGEALLVQTDQPEEMSWVTSPASLY